MRLLIITLLTLILLLILLIIPLQIMIPLQTIPLPTQQTTKQLSTHQEISLPLVKCVPKNTTSQLTLHVYNAPLPNLIVYHAIWTHHKIVANVLSIITSRKKANVSNVLITVSPVDQHNFVISVTQDIIWSRKTNNIQATVLNVIKIVSLVSTNLKIVYLASQDTDSVSPISV